MHTPAARVHREGPERWPVSVEDMRAHCRIHHEDDDALLERLRDAAVAYIEQHCEIALPLTGFAWTIDWTRDVLELPRGPVRAIRKIEITDPLGATTELTAERYAAVADQAGGRLYLGSSDGLLLRARDAVRIEYLAGYGIVAAEGQSIGFPYTFPIVFGADIAAADVLEWPADLVHAIHFLVAHWYENRETAIVGTIAATVPMAAEALINLHRRRGT